MRAIVGVGGITYILCDIFRFWICLFFIKTCNKRNKMLKKFVHLMHFWRFAAQKGKTCYFAFSATLIKAKIALFGPY